LQKKSSYAILCRHYFEPQLRMDRHVLRRYFHKDTDGSNEETPQNSPSPEDELLREALEDPCESLRTELESVKDQLLRRTADFSNKERRYLDRIAEAKQEGIASAITGLLPSLDTLDKALESSHSSDLAEHPWMDGIRQFAKQLEKSLHDVGCTKQEIICGQTLFDPSLHEAIGKVPASDEFPSGSISQVLQSGYMLGEKVLRVSIVQIAE